MLPYDYENIISEVDELKEQIEEVGKKLLKQAHKLKVVETFSKQEEVDYELLNKIFTTRNINIEDICVKLAKEKERFFIEIFDGNTFEEKNEMKNIENLNKKALNIRFNKKIKVFY